MAVEEDLISAVDRSGTNQIERLAIISRDDRHAIPRETRIGGVTMRVPAGDVTLQPDIAIMRAGWRREIQMLPPRIVKAGRGVARIIAGMKRPGIVQWDDGIAQGDWHIRRL